MATTINAMAIAKFLIVLHALIPSFNERGRQLGGLLRRSTALNGHYEITRADGTAGCFSGSDRSPRCPTKEYPRRLELRMVEVSW